MILCVFEGKKREPELFDAINHLFLHDTAMAYFTVDNTFHKLYKDLSSNEWDLIPTLKLMEQHREEQVLSKYNNSDFSEIYLFFDYDFQDRKNTLEQLNAEIDEMLSFFDNETENGKMYVSYPMVEALRYTKTLPDENYHTYTVCREYCKTIGFKQIAVNFSSYSNYDFLIDIRKRETRNNWLLEKLQNVEKANLLCYGKMEEPTDKELLNQKNIFDAQQSKFITTDQCMVSILSSFAMFLFDYLKPKDAVCS